MAVRSAEPEPEPAPDARLGLVLDQAQRGLTRQQADLDNLRARAGTLVAAASLVSSFLGAQALKDSHLPKPAIAAVGVAVLALVVVIASAVVIVWPYTWRWGINAHLLLSAYVEGDDPATLDETRRSLAWYMQDDADTNQVKLDSLFRTLQLALIGVGIEVLSWLLALATN